MSTTTIRWSEPLKKRLAKAAKQTVHALILDALERRVEEIEVDAQFHRLADECWKKIVATGKTVSREDGKAYLEALARGEKPRRPRATRRH